MQIALSLAGSILLVCCAAVPATQDSEAAIAQRFHGQWAPSPQDCLNTGPTGSVIRIDQYGWRGFEDGARVVGVASTTDDEQHLVVTSIGGPEELGGRLILRMTAGDRIAMTKQYSDYVSRTDLVRCS